jgi:plastocyanin
MTSLLLPRSVLVSLAPAHANCNCNTSPNPYGFSPRTITIPRGSTAIWTNSTTAPHTVSSDLGDPVSFDSGTQLYAHSSTYSFTFTVPGTYQYHCNIHSYMTATIIVTG